MAAYDRFRRNRRFIGPPADLIRHLQRVSGPSGEAGDVRVWNATRDHQAVAGIASVRHGAAATYLAGGTSPHGRRGNAHNLLLWRATTELCRTGTDWLDLGGCRYRVGARPCPLQTGARRRASHADRD